ncbi:MAG: glycosyltransferase family 39 protein [Chthoniobacteraceae bacterium]
MYPLILAGGFRLFGESMMLGKIISALSAVLALLLAARLMKSEKRAALWSTLAVYAALPTGFLCAVRSSSDWTFIAFSFAFLLLLKRMESQRTVWLAILTGLTLGAAALTRHVGVLLGAAVTAHALRLIWLAFRAKKAFLPGVFIGVWPEAIVAFLGASLWLSWTVYLKMAPPDTVAPGLYDALGGSLMNQFHLAELFSAVGDYFGQLPNIMEKAGLADSLAETIIYLLLGGIVVTGWVRSIRNKEGVFRATDYYVLAYLTVISLYEWKLPRFLIPLGPWLILYFLDGFTFLSQRLIPKRLSLSLLAPQRLTPTVAALWCTVALLADAALIFLGHPGKLHGPLCVLRSTTQEQFYGPFYRELLEAGKLLSKLPDTTIVGTQGFYANYLHMFSGRPCLDPRLYKETPDVYVQIQDYDEGYRLPGDAWREVFAKGRVRIVIANQFPWEAIVENRHSLSLPLPVGP